LPFIFDRNKMDNMKHRIAEYHRLMELRKTDCLPYLCEQGIDPDELLKELHQSNQDGSYRSGTRIIGPYTFKSEGHPAQSVSLNVKKTEEDDSTYVSIYSYSNH
jgi:hypothetical protein